MKVCFALILLFLFTGCCTSKCCIENKQIKKVARSILNTPDLSYYSR